MQLKNPMAAAEAGGNPADPGPAGERRSAAAFRRAAGTLPALEVSSWWLRWLVGRRPFWTLVRLAVIVPLTLVMFRVVLIPIKVIGISMEPTLFDGRIDFINRLAYLRHGPHRGDIVAILGKDKHFPILKRVVGLPGEHILVRDGRVAVEGRMLEESYVRGVGMMQERPEATLGAREYFVIGDNREVTAYGVVERSAIMGKVLF